MSTLSPNPPPTRPGRFDNGQEWIESLGDVPLHRVLFNPAPGTATEEDLLRHVDGAAKRLVELVNGTLVEKPMGQLEAMLALWLGSRILMVVEANRLGWVYGADCPIRMAAANVRLPDVSFVARETTAGKIEKSRVLRAWPSLVVEIWSDSNTRREMQIKRQECFASGTKLVWEIDWRTRTVEVYTRPESPDATLTEADTLDGGSVLPGFSVPIKQLFSVLDDLEP
ncbi:MAG: Uma2 family endonuclease [Tepidisphaeraceae bacterium]